MNLNTYFSYWAELYKEDMMNNIMPFWMKYGLDTQNGGIYTCVGRDGQLLDTTKSVWFQGRFAFTCCFAYNNIEPCQQWLDAAKSTLDFIEAHCFDTDGRMFFEVTAEGTPLRKRRYVFSESFAAIAMAEYALATGDQTYAQKALSVFKDMRRFLNTPGILEPKYLPSVQAQGHSITMIMINVASRIKKVISDPELDLQIDESLNALKKYFMHPEFKALLETVGPNGEFIDTINGRTINPGHCIETAWFLFDVAADRNGDRELTDMALTILNWSWEWGWDKEYGGIYYFMDRNGYPPQQLEWDQKLWWVHIETLISLLKGYQLTGDKQCMEWFEKVHNYTWTHFKDKEHSEWYGYLNRKGEVLLPLKGGKWKGCFHVPRGLYQCWKMLNSIDEKSHLC